jgi:hypothetical protein
LNPHLYWFAWFTAFVILSVIGHRRKRLTGLSDEYILGSAAGSSISCFAFCKVPSNVSVHYEALESMIDWDGTTALSVACVYGIFLAVKEMRKLLGLAANR